MGPCQVPQHFLETPMPNILLVEDDTALSELIASYLERNGYQVSVLSRGDHVRERARVDPPDLVILDLHMPAFDGFAVLEQLNRRIPANDYLPILVLTADATRDTRLRALALGARDFISKPLDALETMLRIWNLLETRALYKALRELIPAQQIELLRQHRPGPSQ